MEDIKRDSIISGLLDQAGISNTDFTVENCDGGGNNRVVAVKADDKTYVAKWYFSSPDDTRNRLDAEWRFLQYGKNIGINCIPAPLARDVANSVALYDFIEGSKITPGTVSQKAVDQAAEFFCALNEAQSITDAPDLIEELPTASEACFSIKDHFSLLDERFDKLDNISIQSDVDNAAVALVGDIKNDWEKLKDAIANRANELGIAIDYPIDTNDRCISPSDFGFHNAIQTSSGEMFFIDFEYAGWDDPAKMSGDFFFQPQVPVGEEFYNSFNNKVMAAMKNPDEGLARANLLRPVFGFKWCCIMLNAFVPEWARRRTFANPETELMNLKNVQLNKANKAHSILKPMCNNLGA